MNLAIMLNGYDGEANYHGRQNAWNYQGNGLVGAWNTPLNGKSILKI
jgi:hypothetical protein